MAAITDAILGLNYGRPLGESGWNNDYNDVVKKMSSLVQLSVISATTAAQPGSPSDGDVYVLPPSCTGTDWAGNDNDLGVFIVDAWFLITPNDGFSAVAHDTNQKHVVDGGVWVLQGSIYEQYADDSAADTGGVPVDGMYVNSSTGALHVRLT